MSPKTPSAETILAQAVAISDPAQRVAFLDAACGADVALRARLGRLADHHFRAGTFLERPPAAVALDDTAAFEPVEGGTAVGTRIGPYALREQIGEGGMGLVFVAEQTEPVRRKVALKVIKPGMDSRQVIARFEAERQALALMDHPNIAKVHDGGATPDGRPFFVMEYVKGEPITDYCDAHRLTVRQRLELFLQVCRAVQHAHQKGVIHRDLKPGNVLVAVHDVAPVAKVIDFGIAKAVGQSLTDKTVYTGVAQVVGTPLYMSPEQAGMSSLDADTRTDVYSLGVLLYELLTGTTPIDPDAVRKAGYDELRRMIREEEPARPSTRLSTLNAASLSTVADKRGIDPRRLATQVRGELDWVVMRCLEKDRDRRYDSAGTLAADVQRYLAGEPVEAHPPSRWYRLRKFARRKRAAVFTAALVATALALGAAASVWKYLDERAARRDADENRAAADRNADDADRNAKEAHRQTGEAVRAQKDALQAQREAEQQRNEVARNLYFADVRLGLVDWSAGNIGRLTRKLFGHLPAAGREDLRAWEWYYLLSLCHRDERTLLESQGQVRSLAWSPDGRYLAAAGMEGRTRVWDTTTWRVVRSIQLGNDGLSWSPDGRRLAWGTLADDNTVRVWTVQTDEVVILRGHTSSIWTTAWSPDGKRLVSAGMDFTIRVWDAATGACLHAWPVKDGFVTSLAWSPDGTQLAQAADAPKLIIRDATTGHVLRADEMPGNPYSVAWRPDGKRLAVCLRTGGCVVYRTDDWREAARWFAHAGGVTRVAWSSDGTQLASCGNDNLVRVWDPDARTAVHTLRGHRNQLLAIAWEPGNRRLASAGTDNTVKVWAVPPVPEPRRLDAGPAGTLVIAWGDTPDTLLVLDPSVGSLTTWTVTTGQRVGSVTAPKGRRGLLAPAGRWVGATDGNWKDLWASVGEAGAAEPTRINIPLDRFSNSDGVFSPDASRLAVGGWGGLVIVDPRRSEVPFQWRGVGIHGLAWSPDGKFLAGAGRGEEADGGYEMHAGWVHVFDVGQQKRVLKLRHGTNRVEASAVTWSPDGKRLVSGDDNGLVEVWEFPAGRKLASAYLHTARVHALAWSPDGRRVASGSADRTVRVWDPATGEELLRLDTPDTEVKQLLWSADGRRLVAAGGNGAVLVWDATPGYRYLESQEYAWEQIRAQEEEAGNLWNQGRKDDSIALSVRGLERLKAVLGPDHDYTLSRMQLLAHRYWQVQRLKEQVALLEDLVPRRRARSGPDDDDTLRALNDLAVAYTDTGRLPEAIPLLEEVVSKLERKEGDEKEGAEVVMNNLASAYEQSGQFDRAEGVLANLAAILRQKGGPKSPDLAGILARLGQCRLRLHKYAEAEPVLRECLAIRAEVAPDAWNTFNAKSMLGGSLLGQKKYAEAEPLLVEGYEGMKQRETQIPPPGKVRLPEAADRLVELYIALGKPAESAKWRAERAKYPPEQAPP